MIHKLWLVGAGARVAGFQFYLHQLAVLVLSVGLVLLYGGVVPEPAIGPLLGAAAVGVLVALLLMAWLVLRIKGDVAK